MARAPKNHPKPRSKKSFKKKQAIEMANHKVLKSLASK